MKRVILFVAVGIFLLCFLLKGNSTKAQEEMTSLCGHVYGVLEIPKEEMEKVPEEEKHKKLAKEKTIDFKNGSREVRVGISGWVVSIGQRKVITNEEGEFLFESLPAKQVIIAVSFGGTNIIKQRITLHEGEENYQDIVVMKKMNPLLFKSMGSLDTGVMRKKEVKCLKHNYWCVDYVWSDCYKSLLKGNKYCWYELTHPGNKGEKSKKWCNGERNCSPYIGHDENNHCDYSPLS